MILLLKNYSISYFKYFIILIIIGLNKLAAQELPKNFIITDFTIEVPDTISFPNPFNADEEKELMEIIIAGLEKEFGKIQLKHAQEQKILYGQNHFETQFHKYPKKWYDGFIKITNEITVDEDKADRTRYKMYLKIYINSQKNKKLFRNKLAYYFDVLKPVNNFYQAEEISKKEILKYYKYIFEDGLDKKKKSALFEINKNIVEDFDEFLADARYFELDHRIRNYYHYFELDEVNAYRAYRFEMAQENPPMEYYDNSYKYYVDNDAVMVLKIKNNIIPEDLVVKSNIDIHYATDAPGQPWFLMDFKIDRYEESAGHLHYTGAEGKPHVDILYGKIDDLEYHVEYNSYNNYILVFVNDVLAGIFQPDMSRIKFLPRGIQYKVYIKQDFKNEIVANTMHAFMLFMMTEQILWSY